MVSGKKPVGQLEFLERVKRIAIIGMFSDDRLLEELVLKGGNALEIIYCASTRASKDLDFSMGEDFETPESLRVRIQRGLGTAFRDAGFVVFDVKLKAVPAVITEDLMEFWGGYEVDFKIAALADYERHSLDIDKLRRTAQVIGDNNSTKLCIDISKHEFRDSRKPCQIEGYNVSVYSPEMIVAEKIRAVCQQMPEYAPIVKRSRPATARARDFVDIYVVCEKIGVDFGATTFQDILRRTFAIKRVPLRLIGEIPKHREDHRPDFVSVVDTVKPGVNLKEYDFYFDYVVEKCRDLEVLWKVNSPP